MRLSTAIRAIPDSHAAGSSIELVDGRWVLTLPGGHPPLVDTADPAFWPILERDPKTVLDPAPGVGTPPLPLAAIIESALRSDLSYWQEATVPWIRALDIDPSSRIGKAAADAVASRRAGQHHRQQLERWLTRKPWS
jgi:hypothetical protein